MIGWLSRFMEAAEDIECNLRLQGYSAVYDGGRSCVVQIGKLDSLTDRGSCYAREGRVVRSKPDTMASNGEPLSDITGGVAKSDVH